MSSKKILQQKAIDALMEWKSEVEKQAKEQDCNDVESYLETDWDQELYDVAKEVHDELTVRLKEAEDQVCKAALIALKGWKEMGTRRDRLENHLGPLFDAAEALQQIQDE